jgi:hypothetical protein
MSEGVPLEKFVLVGDDGFIPRDIFMKRDMIPGVGLVFSAYRFTEESFHSIIDMIRKPKISSVSDIGYLSRPFIRGIEMLGVSLYNCYLINYLINN